MCICMGYQFCIRGNADDGLLCGVLLLPMVAAAKLIDATNRSLDQYYIGKTWDLFTSHVY